MKKAPSLKKLLLLFIAIGTLLQLAGVWIQLSLSRFAMDGVRRTSRHTIFSGKVFCGECGSIYGSKVWHSTDKYRRVIWQCNAKYKNEETCQTPHLTEDQLKTAFADAFNEMLKEREALLKAYRRILRRITDLSEYRRQAEEAEQEHAEAQLLMEQSIRQNASVAMNQAEYSRCYNELLRRGEDAKAKLKQANDAMHQQELKRRKLLTFMTELEKRTSLLTEFDGELWVAIVEKVTVFDDRLVFEFKDGNNYVVML